MPLVDFTKSNTEAAPSTPAPAPAEKMEVAPAQNTSLSTQTGGFSALEGDFQASDIKLPRLSLLQKTSELVNSGHLPGSIVFKLGETVATMPETFEATVLHLKKQYQEDLPYGSDEKPQVFDTAREVQEAGGSLAYGEENYYKSVAHATLLIEAPAGMDEDLVEALFPYSFEGRAYALAMFTMAGSAYTNGAKPIITALSSTLRRNPAEGRWVVSSEIRRNGKNSWHVPVFKMAGRHGAEFTEFGNSLFS